MYTVKIRKDVNYISFLNNCSIGIYCKKSKKKLFIYCIYTICCLFDVN